MNQKVGFPRDFLLVLIGQIVSLFGNAVMRFALPLHLLNETGSAAILGIVSGCAFIPLAVMSPVGGIIADRVNKRNIMVFLDFFTSGLTLLFLALYGKVNLTALILVLLFMLYGISGAYQPSVQASIPLLVKEDKVMPANAAVNMVSSLSGLLGPALGGVAYSMWGIYPVIAVAAGCFFFSAVMEIFIRIPFKKQKREVSVLLETGRDLKRSLSYINREKPELGKLTVCCAGVNLVMSALMVIGLPVIVMQILEFPKGDASSWYGYMQAILSVGGLAGGMAAGVFSKRFRVKTSWRLILYCGMLLIPMGVVLMLDCSAYAVYAVLAVTGVMIMAFSCIYTIQLMSYFQITVPQELVGKVISWIIAVSICAQPIGQMGYGFLFEKMKNEIFVIFYIAAFLSVMIAWYSRRSTEKL